jgi:hypothetical protein
MVVVARGILLATILKVPTLLWQTTAGEAARPSMTKARRSKADRRVTILTAKGRKNSTGINDF